ncbi:frequency clock protein [Daldinia decipiens]|uniref:frequency clock protein n=1 Tax=Daldinia decipiens TaxID=326647 RepID=UPI0020C52E0C|nr:frequency clock protein [Daldinia decipiens]KAI1659481.1 frequency clock protein [Daldinia decipiens]
MADCKDAPIAPSVTYNNPRRKSPDASITLQYHRQARNASKRDPQIANPPTHPTFSKPRRNSSGDSNETGISDPKKWFDTSNQKAMHTTDIDEAPFYQKETDSSNEEVAKYGLPLQSPAYRIRPVGLAHSNQSADEFRSVIDDLTVENKRLKEELRKYKQMGPDSLRRDKLFEVKVHGLSSRKKRELEAALRDFTTSLEDSSVGPSPSRKKASGKLKNVHSSTSKHASSSSGSNSRPVDSAYASMSAGPSSSVPFLPGQAKAARERSEQKIENYLRDIPEGLWPRPTIMTEKDKKKLVVKRLEHLFTGKMADPAEHILLPQVPEHIVEDVEMGGTINRAAAPSDTMREAQIQPRDSSRKESSSRDNGSASNAHSHSNGDQTDTRDNGNGNATSNSRANESGNNTSPHISTLLPEQRPTRPRDLDPDRRQVPSENMDYIRHLGLVAPESQKQFSARDVSPDAEGWVYLNLLCNLAQLHILNVTPAFIRNAVSEKSTMFQLSPDGRKIRWRGGIEGTKFSSDSGSYSQHNQSSDDTDGSNDQEQRKKQKTQGSGNDVNAHKPSKFGLGVQQSNSSESFHYKPLFVHHQTSSSDEQPSGGDETGSSFGPPEESNMGGMDSRWGQSGVSGISQRKRRRDGAIIYYSGAPFCTDLSGDFGEGEISPATYDMTSSGDHGNKGPMQPMQPHSLGNTRPQFSRSTSGSSLPFRPLSTLQSRSTLMEVDYSDPPELTSAETDDEDIEADFSWSDSKQHAPLLNLEASGLGGTYPEDHFVVIVPTRRPKHAYYDENSASEDEDETPSIRPSLVGRSGQETTESIINKLASMTTNSPAPRQISSVGAHAVQIEYLPGKIRRLNPVPLPPPTFYFPADQSDLDEDEDETMDDSSESLISRQAIVEDGPSSDVDLSGNDEEDEHSDDGQDYDASGSISPENMDERPDVSQLLRGRSIRISQRSVTTGSSAATAGGAVSGYNSSIEDI